MKDFAEFMKNNREKAYAVAHANVKHDSDGHCLFPKDDPWMNDTRCDDDKQCPYCAEVIKKEALVCRYCGRDLSKSEPGATIDYSNGIAEMNEENKDRFNDK